MKPHFGQSDAAMNKLAGCNVLPNNNKPAELKGHFGHELGCDCAVCESMDLRVRYLKQKAADLEEIKRIAYQAGFDAAIGPDFDPVKERDAAYDLGYREGHNAVCDDIHFRRSISIAPKQFKALGERLAELLDDDDWNNIEPMLLQTLTACSERVRTLEDALSQIIDIGSNCDAFRFVLVAKKALKEEI